MMIKNERKIYIWVVILLVLLAVILPVWANSQARIAYAAEATYSNVLDDLEKDASFDFSLYPAKSDDYSMSVITVAEGENGDVYLYIYQPSADTKPLTVSTVQLSTSPKTDIDPLVYRVACVSKSGVFAKYVILGLKVSTDETRYYCITSLHRPFDKDIDKPAADTSQTINDVAINISEQFTFGTINGEPFMRREKIQVIEVTDKFVGFVRYSGGHHLFGGGDACDAHFVAFSTDMKIDELFDADVYYQYYHYYYNPINFSNTTQEYLTDNEDDEDTFCENTVTVTDTEHVDYKGSGIAANTYLRDRIQTVNDFIASENFSNLYSQCALGVMQEYKLTSETEAALRRQQWVLRFVETPYTYHTANVSVGTSVMINSQHVTNVSILRLHFKSAGIEYNLGVIDNKQSGSTSPSNETTTYYDFEEWWKTWWNNFMNVNMDWLTKVLRVLAIIAGVVVGLVVLGLFVRLCRFIKRLFGKRKADYKYQYSRKRRR